MRRIALGLFVAILLGSDLASANWTFSCNYGSQPSVSPAPSPTLYSLVELDGWEAAWYNEWSDLGAFVFFGTTQETRVFRFTHSGLGHQQFYVVLANPTGAGVWNFNATAQSKGTVFMPWGPQEFRIPVNTVAFEDCQGFVETLLIP